MISTVELYKVTYAASTPIVWGSLCSSPVLSMSAEPPRKRKRAFGFFFKQEMLMAYEKFCSSHPCWRSPAGQPGPFSAFSLLDRCSPVPPALIVILQLFLPGLTLLLAWLTVQHSDLGLLFSFSSSTASNLSFSVGSLSPSNCLTIQHSDLGLLFSFSSSTASNLSSVGSLSPSNCLLSLTPSLSAVSGFSSSRSPSCSPGLPAHVLRLFGWSRHISVGHHTLSAVLV